MFDFLRLVNKSHPLEKSYVPENMVSKVNREGRVVQVHKEAWDMFEEMAKEGGKYGQFLDLTSGYRSYERQQKTLEAFVKKYGDSAIGKKVAIPGTSEHQLGLGLDISNFTSENEMRSDAQRFDWIIQNCYRFGFIVRYKKEFEKVTGVEYEPWHLRYVGKEHAMKMKDMNIALEEYVAS